MSKNANVLYETDTRRVLNDVNQCQALVFKTIAVSWQYSSS